MARKAPQKGTQEGDPFGLFSGLEGSWGALGGSWGPRTDFDRFWVNF